MSTTSDPIALVKRFCYEIQQDGNFDLVDEIIDPSYVDKTPTPGAGTDRASLKAGMMYLHSLIKGIKVEIIYCISDGKVVGTTKIIRGTQTGDLFGKPATNGPIEFRIMDFVSVVNGKVTEHWNTIGPVIDL